MGAGSKDLETARKRIEDAFPYNAEGVAALLDNFHRVEAVAYDRADFHLYTVITDLKLALDTDALTPRQRQCVALRYFAELTLEQVAEILDVSLQTVDEYLAASHERLAREMTDGGAGRRGRKLTPLPASRPLYAWVNAVAADAPVYEMPDDVATDLLHWLSERGDDRAHEALYQRRHGAPCVCDECAGGCAEYKRIHERQLWYRYRREVYDDRRNEKSDRFGFYY